MATKKTTTTKALKAKAASTAPDTASTKLSPARLDDLLAEWHACQHSGEDSTDEETDAKTDRGTELERLIAATPAEAIWQTREKLAILRDYAIVGPPPTALHLMMIVSIEADLATFESDYKRIDSRVEARS